MINNYPTDDEAESLEQALQELAERRAESAKRTYRLYWICLIGILITALFLGYLIGWFVYSK